MKLIWSLALALIGCFATAATPPESVVSSPSLHKKTYAFEHRLMPRWTHQTKGAFYDDMRNGLPAKLVDLARDLVGDEFAKQLAVTSVASPEGVLVTFGEPKDAPLCYFVFLQKTPAGFRYLTLEKSIDISGTGVKSAFCEWTDNDSHRNFGLRPYVDSKSFLADITALAQRPANGPPAPSS